MLYVFNVYCILFLGLFCCYVGVMIWNSCVKFKWKYGFFRNEWGWNLLNR